MGQEPLNLLISERVITYDYTEETLSIYIITKAEGKIITTQSPWKRAAT